MLHQNGLVNIVKVCRNNSNLVSKAHVCDEVSVQSMFACTGVRHA